MLGALCWRAQVGRVLAAAKRSGLSVIPLVQTFGHLEFVLKHARFGSMREERDNYMDLCPESDGARALAFELVHQVAALHPGCPRLHIGCDEVFSLGTHALSRAKAASAGEARLFLDHAGAVMNECARLGIVPLLWHDMMARFDVDALRQVAKSRAEVVVWSYGLDVEDAVPAGMWSRFREAGLRVWGASAFKGASQPDAVWVPAARHVTNHQSWVARASQTSLQGVILTGWARFNHPAALCETLPAGLPSLALCMGVLRNGGYSDGLRRRVWAALGLPESLPLVPSAGELSGFHESGADPAFPGGAVFRVLAGLEGTRLQLARTMENRRLFCPPYTHRLSPPLWRRMGWHARSARAAVEAMRRQLTLAAVGVLTPAGLAEVLGAKFATLTQQAADVSRDMRGLLQQHSGLVGMHDVGAGRAAAPQDDDHDDDDEDEEEEDDDVVDGLARSGAGPRAGAGRPGVGTADEDEDEDADVDPANGSAGGWRGGSAGGRAAEAPDASPRAVLAAVVGKASGLGLRSRRAASLPGSASSESFEAQHLMLDPRWFLLGARAVVPPRQSSGFAEQSSASGASSAGAVATAAPAASAAAAQAAAAAAQAASPAAYGSPAPFGSPHGGPAAGSPLPPGPRLSLGPGALAPAATSPAPAPFAAGPHAEPAAALAAAAARSSSDTAAYGSAAGSAGMVVPASPAAIAAAVGVASTAAPLVTTSIAAAASSASGRALPPRQTSASVVTALPAAVVGASSVAALPQSASLAPLPEEGHVPATPSLPGVHRVQLPDGGAAAGQAAPCSSSAGRQPGQPAAVSMALQHAPPSVGRLATADDTSAPSAFGTVPLGGGTLAGQAPGGLVEGAALGGANSDLPSMD